MPRITKAMLEEQNKHLSKSCDRLISEKYHIEEKFKLLEKYSPANTLNTVACTFQQVGQAVAQITTCQQKSIELLEKLTRR